jgi:hypothetical protein
VRGWCFSGCGDGLTVGHHGRSPKMGGTVAMVLHSLRGFFLRLRNDVGNSFHYPWTAESGYTKWVVVAFLTPTCPTVGNSSGQPSASRSGQEACQRPPLTPWLVQWLKVVAKIGLDGFLRFSAFLHLWAKICAQLVGIYRGFGTYA